VSCLEKLQRVLDENDALRANFNALQMQAIPVEVQSAPTPKPILQHVLSPEETEAVHAQLELTLAAYCQNVALAGKLNQTLEPQHRDFSELKMSMRVLQHAQITKQNEVAAGRLAAFHARAQRLRDNWGFERERFAASLNYLRGIHSLCATDQKEYEEQQKSNLKGIRHLTGSIGVAVQDIRDFNQERDSMRAQLTEYERLQEEHQKSELTLVKLSETLDSLRKNVETDSLTAQVRKQMEERQQKIEAFNWSIDDIHAKISTFTVACQQCCDRIAELDAKHARVTREIKDIQNLIQQLAKQREMLKEYLVKYHQTNSTVGGNNIVLMKTIESGFAYDNEPPWKIRQEMLSLKGQLMELDTLAEAQHDFGAHLGTPNVPQIQLPTRKRVALIPMASKGKKR
jgi:chromosome segregation ATPase